MKNTGTSSIVCFTILVLPVFLDEEYWSFRYCVKINDSGIPDLDHNLPKTLHIHQLDNMEQPAAKLVLPVL
jgi:hypothetical protein